MSSDHVFVLGDRYRPDRLSRSFLSSACDRDSTRVKSAGSTDGLTESPSGSAVLLNPSVRLWLCGENLSPCELENALVLHSGLR